MTITKTIQRQPTKFDYASPTQFKFQITKLPKVEYFCTAVNLPGLNATATTQPTPLRDIPLPGEKLSYEPLEMTFLVDENIENFREIAGWLQGLNFPADREQFRKLEESGKDRFPTDGKDAKTTDAGKVKFGATPLGPALSDATLNILTSKNTPNVEVRFSDVFPVSLTGLNFSQNAGDVDYLTASVTFQYKLYEFANKGASKATTIVS